METSTFLALAAAAASVGSLHSLAPDHWVPFTALAKANGWAPAKTARVTLLCGFGHVTISALLGVLGLLLGQRLLISFGERMESAAGLLLIGFGLVYAAWGFRRAAGRHLHGHTHAHYDHVHQPSRMTVPALFLLFSADPCVAVIPLLFAAAPLGAAPAAGIVLVYEASTLVTMVGLVLASRLGLGAIRVPRLHGLDHLSDYGDAVAGAVIATVGVAVAILGW